MLHVVLQKVRGERKDLMRRDLMRKDLMRKDLMRKDLMRKDLMRKEECYLPSQPKPRRGEIKKAGRVNPRKIKKINVISINYF